MNFGELKKSVTGYINRTEASFMRGDLDLLAAAINDAKRAALRKHSFQQLNSQGFIVGASSGVELATITIEPLSINPTAAVLPVKKINACWQFESSTLQRVQQVPMILATDLHNILPVSTTETGYNTPLVKTRAYVLGTKFYVTGLATSGEYLVDVVKNLPDYVIDTDSDFFSENCADWMLFRTLMQLNAYLKETERIQVSKALLDTTWEEIVADDNERAGNHNSANSLD